MIFRYYSSNYDKVLEADKNGCWIAFKTDSGDEDAMFIDDVDKINSPEHALEIIKDRMDWEWEGEEFYARVSHYGLHQVSEDEAEEKLFSLMKEKWNGAKAFLINDWQLPASWSIPETLKDFKEYNMTFYSSREGEFEDLIQEISFEEDFKHSKIENDGTLYLPTLMELRITPLFKKDC